MARTSGEISRANKERDDALNAIHQKQLAEVASKSAARTEAVLNGTSNKLVKNQETVSVSVYKNLASSPVAQFGGGFFLGVIIVSVFFSIRIKRIRKDCDIRLNEARSALNRMLKIVAKD